MEKIAVFAAGNKDVFFPALVALFSIKEKNSNYNFDYYLCFGGATSVELNILEKYGFKYIDTSGIDLGKYTVSSDRDIVHPIEVLLNYYIPNVLYEFGYDYAIKIDWDLLCLNSWNIDEIINPNRIVSSNYFRMDITGEGVPAAIFEKTEINYFNVGFFAAGLRRYFKEKIFNKFVETYSLLTSHENVIEPEQLSFCLSVRNYPLEYISSSYNLKITNIFNFGEIPISSIKNVHFCSHNKPWKQVNFKRLKSYKDDKINLFKFRNLWLDQAEKIDEIKDFISLSELRIINTFYLKESR